jgi:cob(I)alamin adenosyltransferase
LKIYTGFGDKGKTKLFGGKTVDKDNARVEVYGTIDELNSLLGLVLSQKLDAGLADNLILIQSDLFRISSELATPDPKTRAKFQFRIEENDIKRIENLIDEIEKVLSPLKNFILPGGTVTASYLHYARTVCRRGERRLNSLHKKENIDLNILIYFNRLSDFLFVAARYVNKLNKTKDIPWMYPTSQK